MVVGVTYTRFSVKAKGLNATGREALKPTIILPYFLG